MLKVSYTTGNGRITFEFEVDVGKTAFEAIAKLQEIFEEPGCGDCQSKQVRFSVREVAGNKYYNLVCDGCGAQLNFGQNKDGRGLFVKRVDKDDKPVGKNGWYHYQRSTTASRPAADDSAPDGGW
jgi:hypothetical protein